MINTATANKFPLHSNKHIYNLFYYDAATLHWEVFRFCLFYCRTPEKLKTTKCNKREVRITASMNVCIVYVNVQIYYALVYRSEFTILSG